MGVVGSLYGTSFCCCDLSLYLESLGNFSMQAIAAFSTPVLSLISCMGLSLWCEEAVSCCYNIYGGSLDVHRQNRSSGWGPCCCCCGTSYQGAPRGSGRIYVRLCHLCCRAFGILWAPFSSEGGRPSPRQVAALYTGLVLHSSRCLWQEKQEKGSQWGPRNHRYSGRYKYSIVRQFKGTGGLHLLL